MGKTVAVSFEEDSIKIVHASLKGNNLAIDKTEAVDYLKFDEIIEPDQEDSHNEYRKNIAYGPNNNFCF